MPDSDGQAQRARGRVPRFRRPMRVQVGAYQVQSRGASHYDPKDPFYFASSIPWRWFFLLFTAVWLALNAVFMLLYAARPGSVANARPGSLADAFFFSVETLATVGYGVFAPASLYGHVISTIEILCGMAFTAIATGLLFLRFSRPKSRFIYARNPIVTTINNAPALMLRIANGRTAVLTGATASVSVLLDEITAEGQRFRRFHELRLVRPHLPLFPLAWTLIHELGFDSPLHGLDAEFARTRQFRIFVTLTARDHALGATFYDARDYASQDILFGVRYADAVVTDDNGHTMADLARVSEVEELVAAIAEDAAELSEER